MERIVKRIAAALAAMLVALAVAPAAALAADSGSVPMFRLYNQWTWEHFYTASIEERDTLVNAGWAYEAIGWWAPESSDTPVYRLYNPYTYDHHYTTDAAERDACVKAGWRDEGVGWYSSDAKTVPVLREYNPYAKTGTHNYTASQAEHDNLVAAGWRDEGIGWYGTTPGDASSVPPAVVTHVEITNLRTTATAGEECTVTAKASVAGGSGNSILVAGEYWYEDGTYSGYYGYAKSFQDNWGAPPNGQFPSAGTELITCRLLLAMPQGYYLSPDCTFTINGDSTVQYHVNNMGMAPWGRSCMLELEYGITVQ